MCESTLLGLKGCSAVEPTTGLYIDDLGINQFLLSQFITSQYQNGIELFEDKRSLAWRSLQGKLMTSIAPHLKANSVIEGRRIGIISGSNATAQTAKGSGKWIGIKVKITPQETSFLEWLISDMLIYGQSAPIPVKIFNTVTKKLIDSFTLSGDDEVDHVLNRIVKSARRPMEIAIVYESTFNTIKTLPKQGSCLSCGGQPKYSHHCPFVDSVGVELTISGDTIQTIATSPYTNGISLNYNVNCDRGAWLCSIGGQLAMALAYATAIEIIDYGLTVSTTQRSNTTVSISVEEMTNLRNLLTTRFNDEFQAILRYMKLPSDVYCFECRSSTRYVTSIP